MLSLSYNLYTGNLQIDSYRFESIRPLQVVLRFIDHDCQKNIDHFIIENDRYFSDMGGYFAHLFRQNITDFQFKHVESVVSFDFFVR
jgi:hypothetical protein